MISIPMVILIMSLIPNLANVTKRTESLTLASHLSASHLEDIQRQIHSDASAMSTNFYDSGSVLNAPYDDYAIAVYDSMDPNVKTVTVSVWKDTNDDLSYNSNETGFTSITRISVY